jgi:hypothetical protein
MKSALLILFAFQLCNVTTAQETSRDTRRSEEDAFDMVLHIGSSKAPDAKHALQRVAGARNDSEARRLAKHMLRRWNDQQNTFATPMAVQLDSQCLSREILAELFPTETETRVVFLDVAIDSSGKVTSVVPTGPDLDQRVNDAVVDAVKKKRFLPAKPSDQYEASRLRVACVLEAR